MITTIIRCLLTLLLLYGSLHRDRKVDYTQLFSCLFSKRDSNLPLEERKTMSKLVLNFQSENFSMLGPNWAVRLGIWDKVPDGLLLLDGWIEEGSQRKPVQLLVNLSKGCLTYLPVEDEAFWRVGGSL